MILIVGISAGVSVPRGVVISRSGRLRLNVSRMDFWMLLRIVGGFDVWAGGWPCVGGFSFGAGGGRFGGCCIGAVAVLRPSLFASPVVVVVGCSAAGIGMLAGGISCAVGVG